MGTDQKVLALAPVWMSLQTLISSPSSLAYTISVKPLRGHASDVADARACGLKYTLDADPDSLAPRWICTLLNLLCGESIQQ